MGQKHRKDTPLGVQIYFGSATLLFLPLLVGFAMVCANGDTAGARSLIARLNAARAFNAPPASPSSPHRVEIFNLPSPEPAWVRVVEVETQSCWTPSCAAHAQDGLPGAAWRRSTLTNDEADRIVAPTSSFTIVASCIRGWPWTSAGDCWRHDRQPAVFDVRPTGHLAIGSLYLHAVIASDRIWCRELTLEPRPPPPPRFVLYDEE